MNDQLNYQLYKLNDETEINAVVKDETIWLTQKSMAEVFDVDRTSITRHLRNIFDSEELDENSTSAKIALVQKEGNRNVTRNVEFYNLDAIISVGYRVNSLKATRFRQWATGVLKEFMIKGFVLDDERLKLGERTFDKDYFRELIERVRSIRASERRIWQKVTDVFAEIAHDYDSKSETTRLFFANIQNKFHFAITGKTASEIIYSTADKNHESMGLTSWKNAPDGRILKSDVTVAKNYLDEKSIKRLERDVSSYFDYIERLLEDETLLSMEDFALSIDEFLKFNRYDILKGFGSISKKAADNKAIGEYEEFKKKQIIISDFDKQIKEIQGEK